MIARRDQAAFPNQFSHQERQHENKNDSIDDRDVLCALTLCFARPMMGTWKLNEAKSKFARWRAKSMTVVYEAGGDNLKCTIDGVDGKVKPAITCGSENSMAKSIP